MKRILFLLLLPLSFLGHAQIVEEIILSGTLNDHRMGEWVNGDYKVHVDLNSIASDFRILCQSYSDAALNNRDDDSATLMYYDHTFKRFQRAVEEIEKAKNGFDLRNLIVYYGPEVDTLNVGNSKIVESYIMQCVRNGAAAVFYKGKRVFTFKHRYETTGKEILDHGYEIRMYFDDPGNWLFKDHHHLGW
ncbi:MAG: hypothetical protein IPN36_11605 [Bacteroidetes bacterium]|nr:hypothetical protein [Bacteroidota bacterium]